MLISVETITTDNSSSVEGSDVILENVEDVELGLLQILFIICKELHL